MRSFYNIFMASRGRWQHAGSDHGQGIIVMENIGSGLGLIIPAEMIFYRLRTRLHPYQRHRIFIKVGNGILDIPGWAAVGLLS